jgi:hypothetical protein
MFHADDDILFRTVIHKARKSTGALLVVCKQVGLVVSTERTKCKYTSVEENAG